MRAWLGFIGVGGLALLTASAAMAAEVGGVALEDDGGRA